MTPKDALDRIAFLLERNLAESYRVRAFRQASKALDGIAVEQLRGFVARDELRKIAGIGKVSEEVVREALRGDVPAYLERLEKAGPPTMPDDHNHIFQALRGDCHTHSLWSDGGSPILDMARTARELGHEYIVATDHSPNLKVANGLSAERLAAQLEEIIGVNETLQQESDDGAPEFRVLNGIEVDILEDGSLDQHPDLLGLLDVVVASVHSNLRADSATMTKRMIAAIENPRMNILGHCTGRKVVGKGRPPSTFDAEAVFAACIEHDVAVEINCRPERKDPPIELLKEAVAAGCKFSIDTDAHAPGQLAWQPIGTERAAQCGVEVEHVVNTRAADDLIAWARP